MSHNAILVASTFFGTLLLADVSCAQIGGRSPSVPAGVHQAPPPQAIPVTAPPVDHPAYAAQPLMPRSNGDEQQRRPAADPTVVKSRRGPAGPAPVAREAGDEAKAKARAFFGERVAGKELAARVDTVLESLPWHEKLAGARVSAAGLDRPILWIHSLGELDGFA